MNRPRGLIAARLTIGWSFGAASATAADLSPSEVTFTRDIAPVS